MSTEELAEKVSTQPPWWATAPIWLAAGIVGVPSLIAIGAGYFVAHYVTTALKQLDTYGQSELYLLNQHMNDQKHNIDIVMKFIDDDLKVQYRTCLNSSKTDEQRAACITPSEREQEYGIRQRPKRKDPKTGDPSN